MVLYLGFHTTNCYLKERLSQTLMNYAATFCYNHQTDCHITTSVVSCPFGSKLLDYTEISVSGGHQCAQLKWQRGEEKMLFHWQSEMLLAIIKAAGFWLFHQCIQGFFLKTSPSLVVFHIFRSMQVLLCTYKTNRINLYFSAQLISKRVLIVTINCSWE